MLLDSSSLTFTLLVVASVLLKKRCKEEKKNEQSPEVVRLRSLLASGRLTHPFLRADYFQRNINESNCSLRGEDCVANFTDLAGALACCCGVTVSSSSSNSTLLARDIGTSTKHVLLILCDGMGNAILEQHLSETSFLHQYNQSDRLRAVFPSTTPAALTSLATAQWPGQHGVPGWDLREQQGCDYPGSGGSIVQLRILAPRIMNVRTHEPANYSSLDHVFLVPPWSRTIATTPTPASRRRMMYINAYNGDEFPSWYQGKTHASDFSSWQTGQTQETTMLNTGSIATISETAFSTLGESEGSQAALEYFNDGIDKALRFIAEAEGRGESTYTYLYTAHPDKHMHALGTDHPEVKTLVCGFNHAIEQMWNSLGDRSHLLSRFGIEAKNESERTCRIDATLVVTADHGHVSVFPKDMVVLPEDIIECLEYANIGVHGKVSDGNAVLYYSIMSRTFIHVSSISIHQGRHAYLHCRAGLQTTLRDRWRANSFLNDSFLLLTIEEASANWLFGPAPPTLKVRPRLGDFVAISVIQRTLVTPKELNSHKNHCQGAHGSLLKEEMKIPFILCTPSQEST